MLVNPVLEDDLVIVGNPVISVLQVNEVLSVSKEISDLLGQIHSFQVNPVNLVRKVMLVLMDLKVIEVDQVFQENPAYQEDMARLVVLVKEEKTVTEENPVLLVFVVDPVREVRWVYQVQKEKQVNLDFRVFKDNKVKPVRLVLLVKQERWALSENLVTLAEPFQALKVSLDEMEIWDQKVYAAKLVNLAEKVTPASLVSPASTDTKVSKVRKVKTVTT